MEKTPAPATDPRNLGWPCHGKHLPGKEKGNQFGRWLDCKRCALRIYYKTTKQGHGERRTAGPTPEVVQTAMDELEVMAAQGEVAISDTVVKGKIMEVQSRSYLRGYPVPLKTTMGPDKMEMPTCDSRKAMTSKAAPTKKPSNAPPVARTSTRPTTRAATSKDIEENPAELKDQLEVKDGELQEANEQIMYLESRLLEMKGKLRDLEERSDGWENMSVTGNNSRHEDNEDGSRSEL